MWNNETLSIPFCHFSGVSLLYSSTSTLACRKNSASKDARTTLTKKEDSMKRVKLVLLLTMIMMCIVSSYLSATNSMELGLTLIGEHLRDNFGKSIVALDYNGDGYQDLIVLSNYAPTSEYDWLTIGKLYIYYGQSDGMFNTEPSMTILRESIVDSMSTFTKLIAADMNGNGLKDLVIQGTYGYIPPGDVSPIHTFGVHIFYSGPECDSIPDYTYYVPNTGFDTPHPGVLNYLGDVNGDGCDDLGFTESPWITTTTPGHFFDNDYYIMYGDPIEPYVEKLGTYQAETSYFHTIIKGLGDVNNDGCDDIFISYTDPTSVPSNWTWSNGIIFGGTVIDTTLHFIPIPEDHMYADAAEGYPIGDINGDGIDDFIGYMSHPGIWLGNNNLDLNIADIQVNFYISRQAVVYGDFNGDGYADFVLSDDNTPMPQEGQAFLFLGGANPNGVPDLHIRGDDYIWGCYMSAYFGKSMAVADFNNDGYDDLAISAPYNSTTSIQGKVFILLGNPNLSDTTVPTTDEVVEINPVIFNVYPNPAKDILNFEYKNIEDYHNLSIDIYNIKGQKVKEIVLNSKDIKNGTVNTALTNLPSAIYLCRLKSNNQTLNTKKVSVIK
jgi:hypothetical protein